MHKAYSTARVYLATILGIMFYGVTFLSLGTILPQLIEVFHEAAMLPQLLSIGIIAGTLVFGPVTDKFGYKFMLVMSCLFLIAGLLGLAYSREAVFLEAGIIMIGFGGGVINGETSAIVAKIFGDDKRTERMSLLGAFYCIGALLWTVVCWFVPDYKIPLTGAAVMMALCVIYFMSIKFPSADYAGKDDPDTPDSADAGQATGRRGKGLSIGALLFSPVLLICALVLFFQGGIEGATANFSKLYYTSNGLSVSNASVALTFLTVGMLAGRVAMGWFLKRMADVVVLIFYCLVSLAGIVYMQINALSFIAAGISMFLIGFGTGAICPILFSYVGGIYTRNAGTALSIVIFIALGGNFLFNHIIGKAFLTPGGSENFPLILSGLSIIILITAPFVYSVAKSYRKRRGLK
ncbi:MAG: MFS transporter [Bacteroidales bacterium]|jgi:MFS family permease|nr:MFS transporter [Bacteroidales bacterium]